MFRNTAHIYDLVYEASGRDYRAESATLIQQIEERVPTPQSLLDVGCGTGGHLVCLQDRFEVVGVELDANMLVEARRRHHDVELVEGDMRYFDLDRRFDAVVCLFSSVGYMQDRGALGEAIGCMARHLAPTGVLIVDGWVLPEAWKDPGSVHAVSEQRDGIAVARVGRSERRGNKSVLELHHLVASANGVDHLVDHHELTLFAEEDYLDAFRKTQLDVEVIDGPFSDRGRYAGLRHQSPDMPSTNRR